MIRRTTPFAALALLALLWLSAPASAADSPLPGDSVYRLTEVYTDQDGRAFRLADGRGKVRVATMFYTGQPRPAAAGSNDRHQDYVMATGAVSLNPRVQSDGVWLLDYRTGKLLGTVIDKTQGKIVGWAEVDPKQAQRARRS